MDVIKSMADLVKEAKSLGVEPKGPSGRGAKFTKADFIASIAEHNLLKQFGSLDLIPKNLRYRLSIDSPMLCFQYTGLKPEEQANIWTDPNIWLTEKENGVRMLIIYNPSEGMASYSRNISVTDYLPINYGEKILNSIPKGSMPAFCIDVEIKSTNKKLKTFLRDAKGVETETELQAVAALLSINTEDSLDIQRNQMIDGEPLFEFKLITPLYWNKRDLRKTPYKEREALHDEIVSTLVSKGLNVKKIKICKDSAEKKPFHEGILANGGEGTIAVFVDKPYNASVNRHRDEWIKIKRTVSESSQSAGLGDTIDGWVSGYEIADEEKGWAGLIGALQVSVFLQSQDGEKEHMIARVANIPLTLRKKMSETGPDGQPRLKQEFYDKVVEVDGQAISARAMRLTHPRLLRWRDDKSKYDCILSEEFIKSQVL